MDPHPGGSDAHLERLEKHRPDGTVSYGRYPVGWHEQIGAADYRSIPTPGD